MGQLWELKSHYAKLYKKSNWVKNLAMRHLHLPMCLNKAPVLQSSIIFDKKSSESLNRSSRLLSLTLLEVSLNMAIIP